MSAVSGSTTKRLSSQRRLTDIERKEIIAAAVQGEQQTSIGKRFGVSRVTIGKVLKGLRNMPGRSDVAALTDWKRKLVDELPAKSVAAIERSVSDQEDVHRAANTALAHLKGIGVLAPDAGSGASVQVFVGQVSGLPAAWQQEYFSSTTTSSDQGSNDEIIDTETPEVIESKE